LLSKHFGLRVQRVERNLSFDVSSDNTKLSLRKVEAVQRSRDTSLKLLRLNPKNALEKEFLKDAESWAKG
jgi:N-acetylmuramic acid 6-phosphate (MurNAc-6-P) etherase